MSFAEFQEERPSVQLLKRSLDRGRLSHAYLFTGDAVEELEGLARTLAKTLNCQSPPQRGAQGLPLDSCDHCLSCRKIESETHADVQWVRPESKSRVIIIDQIRQLMQTIYLKPTEAPHKIAVLVAADRLNVQAANAFLKTLEEPPAKSIIILLSTAPQRLLETILSRCLRLNFAGEGEARLRAAQEDWLGQFSQIASSDRKGLLSRYRLLSILLTKLAQVKEQADKTLTARSPLERYDDIEPKLRDKWEDELTAAIEAEYRRQRSEVLLTLQWWLRDVWLATLALGEEMWSFPKLAPASQAVARRISSADAVENLAVLEQTQRLLGSNVQEALALEVGFLKLDL